MKTTRDFKRFLSELMLGIFTVTTINPVPAIASLNSDKIIYPLKQISKLECRFNDFGDLGADCKQELPILNTKDYSKYASLNGGYNNYTRLYTVLWGASYKYGWDVGNGGHIGTDIATAKGTPVYTIADGKVINARNDVMLGNFISIEHTIKGKRVVSNYAHLSKMNVSVGDNVLVGNKIGEVGSTGNSTGNHLHFQIDLDTTKKHPYYYSYNSCPFSYYKITEEGVCIDELFKNSIDPLLFLETQGAILDNLSTKNVIVNNSAINNNTIITTTTSSKNDDNLSIFDRTVYIGYSESDIRKVQEIYQKLGIYRGEINGNYQDIIEDIINYQISKKLISTRNESGAGWFGPKTRATTKTDYLKYLADGTKTDDLEIVYETKVENQKIDRVNLMSREEIEKREVEEFLKLYNIELNFINKGGNIEKNGSEILKLNITNRKGQPFKGEMPGGMTFVVNTEKVNVFPEKLFYFTDGKRDIKITGLQEGDTNLYVKIGNETIKTIPLKIYNSSIVLYPTSSKILASNKTILGSKQTGVVAFKDEKNKYMINLKYGSTYNIKASGDNKICIKQGTINNIKKIYSTNCKDEDFKNEFNFTYDDTVGGILVFDYKATSKNFSVVVTNNYNNKKLSEKKIAVSDPKGLANTYVYKKEVVNMLEQGIANGVNQGYFLEDRGLNELDALTWIENALVKIKTKVYDTETTKIINNNLEEIKKSKQIANKYKIVTRLNFLNISYKYLVLDTNNSTKKVYKDIDNETSIKIAKIFDDQTTWKDQFGQNYFRPQNEITRGEGAYLLSKTLEKNAQTYLTLR